MTFPKRLEQLHDRQTGQLEVVNASVNGYMPYNELHFYLAEGRAYQADIVIVAFCMNDIVDPELHWGYRGGGVKRIPQEAIPNPDYHTNHVVPIMERMRQSTVWERFALYRSLRPRVWRIQGPQQPQGEPHVRVCGRQWPTHVTTEDSISIQVLTDYDSPEWRWLRSIYDQLHTAVLKEGAALLVLILPLAYQLDPEYPFIPQELIKRYCKTSSILCLDVLPAFRKHRDEKLFFRTGSDYDYDDIWHLTERGHQLVAEEVEVFLVEHRLVDPG